MNKFLAWLLAVGTTGFFEFIGGVLLSSFRPKGDDFAFIDDDTSPFTAYKYAEDFYTIGCVFTLVIIGLGTWLYLRSAFKGVDDTGHWSKMRNLLLGSSGIGLILTFATLIVSLLIYWKG